jgi:hypothetical protein
MDPPTSTCRESRGPTTTIGKRSHLTEIAANNTEHDLDLDN